MNKSALIVVIVVAVIGVIGVKMFSGGGSKGAAPSAPTSATITIDGSNTMVHLATSWSEAYMKLHPDVKISVNGQGSGTGIASLINGTIDICASSRSMKEKEIAAATEKGFTPKEYSVALDGIAVIINPANGVKEMSFEEIKKVFTGAHTDWKQVGGAPGGIDVISRESSSGTYEFFLEHVLNKEDYTPKAKMLSATSAVIQTISVDTGAIGYVGLGYALEAKGKVKMLNVKQDAKSPAITPSERTVVDGSYPISRALYFYTRGEATGPVKAFIDYCLSSEGQAIVQNTGFVKLAQ